MGASINLVSKIFTGHFLGIRQSLAVFGPVNMPNTHLRQSIPAHFWLHQSDHFTSCTSVEEICRHPGPYILNVASSFSSPWHWSGNRPRDVHSLSDTLSGPWRDLSSLLTTTTTTTTTCTHSLHIYIYTISPSCLLVADTNTCSVYTFQVPVYHLILHWSYNSLSQC